MVARLRLDRRDQRRDRLHREDARVHHQRIGPGHQQRDGREVGFEIVGQVAVDRRVDAVGTGIAKQQRAAIGRRAEHILHAHAPSRAGAVVHHEGLAEGAFQMRREEADGGVVPTARRARPGSTMRTGRVSHPCARAIEGMASAATASMAWRRNMEHRP